MGAEPVIVLYASISVLNCMRAATGSQCKETKRGVTWALLLLHLSLLLLHLFTKLCIMLVIECVTSRAVPPVAINNRGGNRPPPVTRLSRPPSQP